MRCPACGYENREGARFCGECAAPLTRTLTCSNCGSENPAGQKFCDSCSHSLGSASAPTTPQSQLTSRPVEPTSFVSGRYAVKRFLGEGGKKRVYLAHDTLLDRDVAFALIKTEGLDPSTSSGQAAPERITREAQAMGRLGDHPHRL